MVFQLFLLFKSVGTLFLIGSLAYFFLGKDAAVKRKLMLPFFVAGGVLTVGVTYYSQGLIAALAASALVVFVSQLFLRTLVICDPCGRIVNDRHGRVPESCPSCHTSLPKTMVSSVSI